MTYKQTVEIKGDNRNAVESFIHEAKKQADEADKFGVDISIRRVEEQPEHDKGFDE